MMCGAHNVPGIRVFFEARASWKQDSTLTSLPTAGEFHSAAGRNPIAASHQLSAISSWCSPLRVSVPELISRRGHSSSFFGVSSTARRSRDNSLFNAKAQSDSSSQMFSWARRPLGPVTLRLNGNVAKSSQELRKRSSWTRRRGLLFSCPSCVPARFFGRSRSTASLRSTALVVQCSEAATTIGTSKRGDAKKAGRMQIRCALRRLFGARRRDFSRKAGTAGNSLRRGEYLPPNS